MRVAAVSLGVLTVAAMAGCLLPDLSVYTGATPSGDASVTDVAIPDSASSTDGGKDAARFCAGKNTAFCADFDEADLLAAYANGAPTKWSSTDIDPSGSLTLDSTRSVSAPAALFAALPRRGDVSQNPHEQIRWISQGPWHPIRVSAQIYFENPGWMSGDINASVFSWSCYSDGPDTVALVILGEKYTQVSEVDAAPLTGKPFPTDAWTPVVFTFDPGGSLRLDYGSNFIQQTFTPKTPSTSPLCFLVLGIDSFNDPVPPFRIHYDDVTVENL